MSDLRHDIEIMAGREDGDLRMSDIAFNEALLELIYAVDFFLASDGGFCEWDHKQVRDGGPGDQFAYVHRDPCARCRLEDAYSSRRTPTGDGGIR